MSEFNLTNAFASFQDTFGTGQYGTNGAAMIQAAAGGQESAGAFKIGFNDTITGSAIENRVFIKIPSLYWKEGTLTQFLSPTPPKTARNPNPNPAWSGIYFPVTPSIKQDAKVNWAQTNVQHSNYAVYSYVNSDVGSISVSGQFPVQTQEEAIYWLATVHALRALTKMRTGQDVLPGAPPPVCRFNAYGANVYENVPVVIGGYSIDLPSDVDYITGFNLNGYSNKVPTLSTISITLLPVYSRREMSRYGVDKFIDGTLGGQGYL